MRAVSWLLEYVPRTLRVRNKMGHRPVDLARRAGQKEIVALIEAHERAFFGDGQGIKVEDLPGWRNSSARHGGAISSAALPP